MLSIIVSLTGDLLMVTFCATGAGNWIGGDSNFFKVSVKLILIGDFLRSGRLATGDFEPLTTGAATFNASFLVREIYECRNTRTCVVQLNR